MQYLLSGHDKIIRAVVQLPSSKSISNRVLIMNAISFSPYGIGNLSDSDDTRVMKQVIDSNSSKFNIGHAGTAMRFLTAFLSRIVGEWMLTGSERMKQRPIGILVDALRELGADIRSAGKVGYPPIVIRGSHLKGKLLELDAASAPVSFRLADDRSDPGRGAATEPEKTGSPPAPISNDTCLMTNSHPLEWKDDQIRIEEQPTCPPHTVESDWSGASYWSSPCMADEERLNCLTCTCPAFRATVYWQTGQAFALPAGIPKQRGDQQNNGRSAEKLELTLLKSRHRSNHGCLMRAERLLFISVVWNTEDQRNDQDCSPAT